MLPLPADPVLAPLSVVEPDFMEPVVPVEPVAPLVPARGTSLPLAGLRPVPLSPMFDSVSLLDPPFILPLAADPRSVVPLPDDLAPEELEPAPIDPEDDELEPMDPEDPPIDEPEATETPNALAVLLSSWPVTESFSDCWNRRNACVVRGPITPSMGPGLCPFCCSACCAWRISSRDQFPCADH